MTAAPLLEVRLVASIEEWRDSFWYQHGVLLSAAPAACREKLDQQWRDLMRMGAEMERVTIVEPDLTVIQSAATDHVSTANPPLRPPRLISPFRFHPTVVAGDRDGPSLLLLPRSAFCLHSHPTLRIDRVPRRGRRRPQPNRG